MATHSSTRKVRLLDPHTVNQIAAGEVVERPASAVKELVENALDAGATRIDVTLKDAGRSLIEVSDNGCGMSREDAESSLERHATSKIGSTADLLVVGTFGFRGEALPSMASVSRLVMTTGETEGLRHVITVVHGLVLPTESTSGPQGTCVRVEDIFLNLPARLKFLKTDATELSACVEVVSKFAISRPDVAFRLVHHENQLLQTSGLDDPLNAVAEVWSRDVARGLVPVDLYDGNSRVRGFVSPPHFTKPTRAMQWIFVNGRPVRSRSLTAAIDQAYRSLTPERRYPLVLLDVQLDPATVDVNVSPSKSEVKFHQEGRVFDGVRRAVKEALLAGGMMPSVGDIANANAALVAARPSDVTDTQLAWGLPLHGGVDLSILDYNHASPDVQSVPSVQGQSGFADFLDGLRILGQVEDTFIIAENKSALLIVDQHVAHERVIYEALLRTRGTTDIEVQRLLTPETLHVQKHVASVLSEKLDDLRAIGFDLEPFGAESFLIRAVPALGRGRTALQALRELVDDMADGVPTGHLVPTRDDVFIMCSCKMAVKAGDKLGFAEMQKLLEDLAATENPYLCPHGRPITIVMPKRDLMRRFKR